MLPLLSGWVNIAFTSRLGAGILPFAIKLLRRMKSSNCHYYLISINYDAMAVRI